MFSKTLSTIYVLQTLKLRNNPVKTFEIFTTDGELQKKQQNMQKKNFAKN